MCVQIVRNKDDDYKTIEIRYAMNNKIKCFLVY